MNKTLPRLAVLAAVLVGVAYGQAASAPSTSIVSDNNPETGIQPVRPASPDTNEDITVDPVSLLPDLAPLPHTNATLAGGTIQKLDRLRDQITVNLFGGGKMVVLFDPRSRIFTNGAAATTADLREGQRIYLDTILDGTTVFARTIRIKTAAAIGQSQGVVLKYRPDRGELIVRDAITPSALHVRVNSSTRVMQGDRAVPISRLMPSSLIGIKFDSSQGDRTLAREIAILAAPGDRYTVAGQITHLNLSTGLLVLNSSVDRKTYEIYLTPSIGQDENLLTGATVTIDARFQDSRYVADKITIQSQPR